jgi:type II secretory pathway component PulF
MVRYFYKAKVGPTDIRQGVVDASDRQNAALKITQLGYIPLDINEDNIELSTTEGSKLPQLFRPSRVSFKDLSIFLRKLNDLVDAEIPLLRSLQLIESQTKNVFFRAILQQMRLAVQDGDSLSKALSTRLDIFPAYLASMVKAGEATGHLKSVLGRLCHLIEKQEESIIKVKTSLVYPALILSIGLLTVFILMIFVIPRMAAMFVDLGQELPALTNIFLNTSHFISVFWWLPLISLVVLFLGIRKMRNTVHGKILLDQIVLMVPFIGEFLKNLELARFARTMGILLENGVEIISAIGCVQGVVSNEVIRAEIEKISKAVSQGSSLTMAFRSSSMFSSTVTSMIGVGEESGHIEKGFLKWAELYERESDRTVKIATTLLEPVLILFIGGFVGLMVMAMLLPIFRMNLSVN